jgi:hypothetical protein
VADLLGLGATNRFSNPYESLLARNNGGAAFGGGIGGGGIGFGLDGLLGGAGLQGTGVGGGGLGGFGDMSALSGLDGIFGGLSGFGISGLGGGGLAGLGGGGGIESLLGGLSTGLEGFGAGLGFGKNVGLGGGGFGGLGGGFTGLGGGDPTMALISSLLGGGQGGGDPTMALLASLLGGGGLFGDEDQGTTYASARGRAFDAFDEDAAPPPVRPRALDTLTTAAVADDTPEGRVWGDPHYVGLDGGVFDVQGVDGEIYNILSDSNVQVNSQYKKWNGNDGITVVDKTGIKVGTNDTFNTKGEQKATEIQIEAGDAAPKVDGEDLALGQTKEFDTGLKDKDGKYVKGFVKYVEEGGVKKVVVNTGEYEMTYTKQGTGANTYLDQGTKVTTLGVKSDGVLAHGILGETAHFDGTKRDGKQGAGAQGEGAIDGVYTDYKVTGLFATSNKEVTDIKTNKKVFTNRFMLDPFSLTAEEKEKYGFVDVAFGTGSGKAGSETKA